LEARRSVRALRPQMLEENELAAALQNLIKKMSDGTGLKAEFTLQGPPHPLPLIGTNI
jgi:signal transduction histidine kinase